MLAANQPAIEYVRPDCEGTDSFSAEADSVNKNYATAWEYFTSPITAQTDVQKFNILSTTWKNDTKYSSFASDLLTNRSYLEIIAMGRKALPFIFQDLEREPEHWFMALNVITGIDPVSLENKGNLVAMSRIWLDWGIQNGYVA